MAHGQQHAGGHPDMDYPEHEHSYRVFLGLAKWSAISSIVVLILMAITLL